MKSLAPRRLAAPRLLGFVAISIALAGCATAPSSDPGRVINAWVQYGPDGTVSARAIMRAGQPCPMLEGVTEKRPMQLRAAASARGADSRQAFNPDFNVISCETEARGLGTTVRIGEHELRLPVETPRRIVIVGDTGCNIKIDNKGNGTLQNCRNGEEWPWARIAASATALQPDLVIHSGDYHYREQCDDPARCAALRAANVAVSYGWEGWNADFFTPAAPLLAAAPWVFVRGNHENCDRGGEGWMRFLAPQGYSACPRQLYRTDSRSRLETNHTAPGYYINLGKPLGLLVLDTGAYEDWRPAEEVPEDVSLLRQHLGALSQAGESQPVWVLTHKPVWNELIKQEISTTALPAATRSTLPENVEMILSGHVHALSTLNFERGADKEQYPTGRPAQMIVGASGTLLEAQDPKSPYFEGKKPGSKERKATSPYLHDGVRAESGLVLNRFSFLLLEREDQQWVGHLMDPNGRKLTTCAIADGSKQMRCDFPN